MVEIHKKVLDVNRKELASFLAWTILIICSFQLLHQFRISIMCLSSTREYHIIVLLLWSGRATHGHSCCAFWTIGGSVRVAPNDDRTSLVDDWYQAISCFLTCSLNLFKRSRLSHNLYTYHISVSWHCHGGAYLLSIAALPSPSPNEDSYQFVFPGEDERLLWPTVAPGIESF